MLQRRELVEQRYVGTANYFQFLRITQDEEGNAVDWFGFFGYVGEGHIIEGYAYEVVLLDGRPVLQRVQPGGTLRLYEKKIKFTVFQHFTWTRLTDSAYHNFESETEVRAPCIAIDSVEGKDITLSGHFFSEIRRKILILRPVLLRNGKVVMDLIFKPE